MFSGLPAADIRAVLRISLIALACCADRAYGSADESGSGAWGRPHAPSILSGAITDILTGSPISNVAVTIAGNTVKTDPYGRYIVTGLPPGTNRMEIADDRVITRSLMVKHSMETHLDVTVKLATFNNAMFWASASHSEHIMRWRKPPRWVIYTHLLDTDPPVPSPDDTSMYLRKIITEELPAISTFFTDPEIEMFGGRPNDDPRWTGAKPADDYILCAAVQKGGGYSWWKAPGYWVRYAKVQNNIGSLKVWRHEIAHALGMGHAVRDKKWLPLGRKDPNYRPTKLADGVEMYTDWDKLWLRCVYSGSRPAANTPPDRDPDDYVHGDPVR